MMAQKKDPTEAYPIGSAHYHALKATKKWSEYLHAVEAGSTESTGEKAARAREKLHDSTYYKTEHGETP